MKPLRGNDRDPVAGAPDGVDEGVIRPLVFDGARVYLERYWRYERRVGDLLLDQPNGQPSGLAAPPVRSEASGAAIDAVLDQYFGPDDPDRPDLQRHGARVALTRRITVLAGGPGTGKTHTVARLLAALHQLAADDDRPLQVALAAPTGKAAARMTEAVHQAVAGGHLPKAASQPLLANEAGTIHRFLGHRDGISFRHDRTNPLPHDVVVVDETSMVALPLMARLLDALRPDARVVLVGDPFQLASVEAGAVLGDVVGPATDIDAALDGPLTDNIVVLQRVHRFAADSAIAALAHAVRSGDADLAIEVLRDTGSDDVQWIDPADRKALGQLQDTVVSGAAEVARAASEGTSSRWSPRSRRTSPHRSRGNACPSYTGTRCSQCPPTADRPSLVPTRLPSDSLRSATRDTGRIFCGFRDSRRHRPGAWLASRSSQHACLALWRSRQAVIRGSHRAVASTAQDLARQPCPLWQAPPPRRYITRRMPRLPCSLSCASLILVVR